MTRGWTNIMEQAGDEHVGQTLVRLARLAVAIDRAESAERLRRQYARDGDLALVQQAGAGEPAGSTMEARP